MYTYPDSCCPLVRMARVYITITTKKDITNWKYAILMKQLPFFNGY